MKKNPEPIGNTFSTINANTRITGEIQSDSDLRIDGSVTGNINSKSKVILGSTAKLKGNIICQNADISCEVHGNVFIEGQLRLNSTAVIKGDIFTKTLIVDSGAMFNGRCEMGNNTLPSDLFTTKPSQKHISENLGHSVGEEKQSTAELF